MLDDQVVQEAALSACSRLRSVDIDLIPRLAEGMLDASPAAAYATAQLLSALGISPNVGAPETQAILSEFSTALKNEDTLREVYVPVKDSDRLEYRGKVAETIYRGFLQVSGVGAADENNNLDDDYTDVWDDNYLNEE
jgi:hypothetical protein